MTNIQKYWQDYLRSANLPETEEYFDAWPFGDNPELADELLNLILKDKKTTTTGLLKEHEHYNYCISKKGDKIIILTGQNEPGCIIEIQENKQMKFSEMNDLQFAIDEGEGFDTLEKWRDVHKRYFSRILSSISAVSTEKITFDEDLIILCVRFKLIYR
jgi:uncharacterized protein YhfF